ncbi:MAG: tRNA sulfurtransferase [Salinigranum sp.]
MKPPGAETVVVRYGKISTKSPRVRGRMSAQLAENISALLEARGVEGTVERRHSRLLVRTDEERVGAATAVAADAFGVVSASPAVTVPPRADAIASALADAARACYDGGTFAVRARRAGTEFPFTSEDLERRGGDAVWGAVEDRLDPEVDLDDPDLTFHVDCRREDAFVFLEKRPGPGGLPLGTQRPLVALVSGGIDSPVAAYEAMRRGSPVVPVYVDLGDYGGPDHRARAVETVRSLARYAPNFDMRVRVVPGGETVALLADRMDRGRMLSFRRYTFRVGEHVARAEGAAGLVTGEAIGQKSSQTAGNLAVTDTATSLPVHRPLLTADKTDIVERAKAVGTYADATIPAGCNRLAPSRPETNGRLSALRAVEPDDLFERAERDAARVELVDLPASD